MEAVDCNIVATWMSLDNGLHHWLAALRAGVINMQGDGHLRFLSR
jgi:hypothetical protein